MTKAMGKTKPVEGGEEAEGHRGREDGSWKTCHYVG